MEITSPDPASQLTVFQLCDRVREASLALHKFLRHGHLEKVYQTGLLHRLRKQSLTADAEISLQVRDEDETVLGDFHADLVVDGRLLVELKAIKELTDEHVAQVLGFMRASGIEHALLINFGGARLEIRKFILNDAFRPTVATAKARRNLFSLLFAPLCAFLWQ